MQVPYKKLLLALFVGAVMTVPNFFAETHSLSPEIKDAYARLRGFNVIMDRGTGLEGSYDEKLLSILNDSVENHMEYFTLSGRVTFRRWLDRSARYLPLMREIFREKNLPEELAYLAMIESEFDPYAVSRAQAVGQWQFMPATGKRYGLRIDRWVDERKDPVKSTRAAARHLTDLYNLFGSWPLALAAYNAGAGKVQRALLSAPSGEFRDLNLSRYIRKETKQYVPRYMAAAIIARDPEAYGFSAANDGPFTYDEVIVDDSTDLRLIGRWLGCTREELRELNPELEQDTTPPGSPYVLRIPKGTREAVVTRFATADTKRLALGNFAEKGLDLRTTVMLAGLPGQSHTAPGPPAGLYPPADSYPEDRMGLRDGAFTFFTRTVDNR
ncbi:MAG: lytic transglycosylase domain-containing protein [Nitrospirota bacterium]